MRSSSRRTTELFSHRQPVAVIHWNPVTRAAVRSIVAAVAGLLLGLLWFLAPFQRSDLRLDYAYDARSGSPIGDHVDLPRAPSEQGLLLESRRNGSVWSRYDHRSHLARASARPADYGSAAKAGKEVLQAGSTLAARAAPNTAAGLGDDLVRFDPQWASRQLAGQNLPGSTGWATTPGGRTLSVHAAERTFLGGPGRAPINPGLIDDILAQGTRVSYRGLNDTIRIGAPNLCGRCYVVVDAQNVNHIVTVMVPK